MELSIISPRSVETYHIVWLDIMTPAGGFIIQDGHAPMIVTLQQGKPFIFSLDNGVQKSVQVDTGIAIVNRTTVSITMNELPHE